jgi:hypothetical protein
MSSQTQPQNVHVAYFTISIDILGVLPGLFVARTGRHEERSSKLTTAEAAARPPRLVATFFDHGPMLDVLFRQNPKTDGLFALWGGVWLFHGSIVQS